MSSKPIRFAALIRVSDKKQEERGESLRSQTADNQRDVQTLNGTIVETYGGQEHASPGFEHAEVDRMIADAIKGKFDAVIVQYADRWSRDNAKSKEGLQVFRDYGIKFYVGTTAKNLFLPDVRLELGFQAEIGEYIALLQAKKSLDNRIARAKRNIPTSGKLPYGRTFDPDPPKGTGKGWGIDPEKQANIQDIAKRYLAGESLPALAKEYRINHSFLCKTLRYRCGTAWTISFNDDRLDIHDKVPQEIPRLLEDDVIRDVLRRLDYTRDRCRKGGRRVNDYFLSTHVFCATCGYAMSGKPNTQGVPHYRHPSHDGAMKCPAYPRPYVHAGKLDEEVIKKLFTMFGSPAQIDRAIKDAIPDCDAALKLRQRLEKEIAKREQGVSSILRLVAKGVVSEDEAERQLTEERDVRDTLQKQLDILNAELVNVPSEQQIRCYVERIESALTLDGKRIEYDPTNTPIFVFDEDGNQQPGGNDIATYQDMTAEDKKALVRAVFDLPQADGKPAGVYVYLEGEGKPHRPKKWAFTIKGRLDFEVVMSRVSHAPATGSSRPPAWPRAARPGGCCCRRR
jgi:DNA invertase Pin-like site-specific DNA recombinase